MTDERGGDRIGRQGRSSYVVVLRLTGESEEVQVQTRWKDRDGKPIFVEASPLSRREVAAAAMDEEIGEGEEPGRWRPDESQIGDADLNTRRLSPRRIDREPTRSKSTRFVGLARRSSTSAVYPAGRCGR
jgi:hypothetical protein